jgi:hypothetical protein
MTETRIFANYATDLNGNGIVEGNGYMLPVEGEFPLQVGDTVRIYSRQFEYLGTDGDGGGIFGDLFDAGEVYGSDVVRLGDGDPFPDPLAEELPLNGEDPGQEPPNVPVISIAPADATPLEGDEGTTEYTFSVTRTGDELLGTSSVQVALVPGNTDADDFGGTLPETQTVTFAPGQTEKTVAITGSGDIDPELDEAFEVSLEFATDATIDETASSAVGTIVNDDVEDPSAADPVISIGLAEISQEEGDSGTTEYRFSVTRTGDGSGAAAVQVAFDAGDTNPGDFGGTLPDDTVTVFFEPGKLVEEIVIEVSGDTDVEADEAFTLSLQNAAGATIDAAASSAAGTIVNDDESSEDETEVVVGTDEADFLLGSPGDDLIVGRAGNDLIVGRDGDDAILGGDDNDIIFGGDGNDVIAGGEDNDALNGGNDDDILYGDDGRDVLDGGSGNDLLIAGDDKDGDVLTGGSGSDVFLFFGDNGKDTITDFTNGVDKIDLSDYFVFGIDDLDIQKDDADTVISDYNGLGDNITLENFAALNLDNSDFIFG